MPRSTFRAPVLAAALAFRGKVLPEVVRKAAAQAAGHAMRWLDKRRERLDSDVL